MLKITISNKCISWLLICYLFVVANCAQRTDETVNSTEVTAISDTVQHYLEKLCNGTHSCDVIDTIPSEYRTLDVRNCMCDNQCSDYGDCCEDSNHKPKTSTRPDKTKFECVATLIDGNVYMINSCPSEWNESSAIVDNCLNQDTNLLNVDILLSTPVTSRPTNRTYRNLFCALCNNDPEFQFWDILVTHEDIMTAIIEGEHFGINVPTLSPLSNDTINYTEFSDTPSEFQINANVILDNMRLNESYFWQFSILNNKCYLNATIPTNISSSVRHCIPNVINTCDADWTDLEEQISLNCAAADQIAYVFVGNKTYKNKFCAECNNVASIHGKMCRAKNLPRERKKIYQPFRASIFDERLRKLPIRCSEIPSSLAVHGWICPPPVNENNQDNRPLKNTCFPMRKDLVPPKPCLINRFFSRNDSRITFLDNETIDLDGTVYRYDEEFWNYSDEQLIICGTYINSPKHTQFVLMIDDILTSILIKVSIICLFLQLLMFQQLAELKNLSGKNLACFSFTLMIAFICYDIGPTLRLWIGSCRETAIVLHYSLLSCFMWMFIMSYDCWLSLYRATAQFRTAVGKHNLKFIVYCIICWTLPLSIVCYSVYLEYSPAYDDICFLQPGYGLPDNCFFFNDKAIYYLFFIPASASFVGNIGFFAHTAYMIYLSQRKSVNPNTRNDFRLYTRLALMMGLTWTLGSLTYITHSTFIGLLFTVMNMSQGIFIFFGFTFKKKFIKLLLDKHKSNNFLNVTLSTFTSTKSMKIVSENKTETEAV